MLRPGRDHAQPVCPRVKEGEDRDFIRLQWWRCDERQRRPAGVGDNVEVGWGAGEGPRSSLQESELFEEGGRASVDVLAGAKKVNHMSKGCATYRDGLDDERAVAQNAQEHVPPFISDLADTSSTAVFLCGL